MLMILAMLALGILFLSKGSDWLVDGASGVAKSLGISDFIIGITLVAVGTSLPELASGIYSTYIGSYDIVVSNVIGSNIANITLVLGAVAILGTIKFSWNVSKRDLVILIGSAFICFPILSTGTITNYLGILLIIIYGAYVFDIIFEYNNVNGDKKKTRKSKINYKDFGYVLIGFIMIPIGAKLTIDAAIDIATLFSISERVIGLSIVAIGTSLPELAVSISAALKKKGAMVIGNVAGSNAFNVLGVLGITSLIHDLPINALSLSVDLPVMLLASLFFIFIWDRDVTRFEGIILLTFFLVYMSILF